MSDKSRELEDELGVAADELQHLESLLDHPGWKIVMQMVDEQSTFRITEVMNPLPGFGAALAQEFAKGEASGMKLVPTMAQGRIEILRMERTTLNKQLEQEMEREAETEAGSRSRVDDEHFWGGEPELDGTDSADAANTD